MRATMRAMRLRMTTRSTRSRADPDAESTEAWMSVPGNLYPAYACTANVLIGPLRGLALKLLVKLAAMKIGAVSPMTRAIASMVPVTRPAMAVGSTIRVMVANLVTPSAYDASRSTEETSLSISSLERTTIGIISTDKATEAENPLNALAGPMMIVNSEKAARPATTIE